MITARLGRLHRVTDALQGYWRLLGGVSSLLSRLIVYGFDSAPSVAPRNGCRTMTTLYLPPDPEGESPPNRLGSKSPPDLGGRKGVVRMIGLYTRRFFEAAVGAFPEAHPRYPIRNG